MWSQVQGCWWGAQSGAARQALLFGIVLEHSRSRATGEHVQWGSSLADRGIPRWHGARASPQHAAYRALSLPSSRGRQAGEC